MCSVLTFIPSSAKGLAPVGPPNTTPSGNMGRVLGAERREHLRGHI